MSICAEARPVLSGTCSSTQCLWQCWCICHRHQRLTSPEIQRDRLKVNISVPSPWWLAFSFSMVATSKSEKLVPGTFFWCCWKMLLRHKTTVKTASTFALGFASGFLQHQNMNGVVTIKHAPTKHMTKKTLLRHQERGCIADRTCRKIGGCYLDHNQSYSTHGTWKFT